MDQQLDITGILDWLPHRYPFVMVDRVTELEPGKFIKAYKLVTINEPFFVGHFPTRPVMPGVLMVEGLAQTGGLLQLLTSEEPLNEETPFYFVGIDKVRFKRVVQPGDRLDFYVASIKERRGLISCQGEASVDDEVACKAEFMLKRG